MKASRIYLGGEIFDIFLLMSGRGRTAGEAAAGLLLADAGRGRFILTMRCMRIRPFIDHNLLAIYPRPVWPASRRKTPCRLLPAAGCGAALLVMRDLSLCRFLLD